MEFENTNGLGRGREYHRFDVPKGGQLFPSYLLNHAFRDCDTFVSLAKLKDHMTAGVTLSMKNCFGNIPTTIYGDYVPKDEPDLVPRSGRGLRVPRRRRASHRASRRRSSIRPRRATRAIGCRA